MTAGAGDSQAAALLAVLELGEDGSYTEPAIDPVWWTQDFSLSWRTM